MRRSDHGGGRVGVWDEWSRVRIARESWDDGVERVVNGEIGDRVQSCLDERRHGAPGGTSAGAEAIPRSLPANTAASASSAWACGSRCRAAAI